MEKVTKGALAFCSLGCLGLITEERPEEVTYSDGSKGIAYVGIHLTDKITSVGARWSSRRPRVIGHINQFLDQGEKNV